MGLGLSFVFGVVATLDLLPHPLPFLPTLRLGPVEIRSPRPTALAFVLVGGG